LIEKDPIVRLALEAMADDGDDDEHDTCDKTDPSDPAYLRNRITRAAAALDKSGNVCFERGEYDQAFERYSKALTLKKRMMSMGGTDTNSTSNSNHTSTSTDKKPKQQQQRGEHNNNNSSNSSNKNNKGQQQEEVEDKSILASLATSINNTAYLKQRAGHASTDETMASYLKSLQIKRDILGPDHLSVGKTLNNIGSVFYLKREFEPALAAYKDACRIMTAVLGAEHLDVGTVVCNIGDVYSATALAEQALEQYRRALPIRWKHLGPKDPKVVRLMEQISSLEMGRLPVPAEDHLSDSESEEFAEQDKKRHAEFKQDLRTLQRELEEDMKFFDLMERQAAIEMVKDKVRVFREMRELANPQLEPEKVKVNASVNANANVPINNTPSYVQAWQQHQQVKLHLTPAPAATPSYVQAWQQHQQGELHLTPLLATVVETETGSNSSPSSTQHMESEYLSLPDQPRATQSGALAPRKPTLSAEQRQNALSSVRDRLARLRESRDFIKSGLAGDALPIAALPGAIPVTRKATGTTKTMGHQSYMEPTASSRSKTHTASPTRLFVGTTTPERKKVDESAVSPPTRLFLGTPERENVDEGINNLRNSPTSSPSGSVGAYNAPTVTNTTTAYDDCMNREHDVTKKLIEREIRATAGIGSGTVG
jgi:tetratricopeptide (TPR) repeat protein